MRERCGLERADNLPVVEFGSLHVTACDRQAIRPADMNGEHSIVETAAFTEHQPCDPYFFQKGHRPARRIDQQHARVVGIKIVAHRNLTVCNGVRGGRLFCKVQVMSQCLTFEEVLVVKLRCPPVRPIKRDSSASASSAKAEFLVVVL